MEREAADPAVQSFNRLMNFVRALNHSIRTPLSVVSNDLFHFKSIIADAEFDRPIARCAEIVKILDQTKTCGATELGIDSVDASELLEEICAPLGLPIPQPRDCKLRADRGRLAAAFRRLLEMLAAGSAEKTAGAELEAGFDGAIFSLRVRTKCRRPDAAASFLQALQAVSGQDCLAAVLLESLFAAHRIDCSLQPGPLLSFEFSMEAQSP